MASIFDNISFGEGVEPSSDPFSFNVGLGNAYSLPADAQEASGIAWAVPSVIPDAAGGQSQSAPWWESVIKYGMVRAIDNQFARPVATGNVAPGSFAGQNGRTYVMTPTPTQPRVSPFQSADAQSGGGLGLLVLVGLGALVAAG
jgi:hypothetical protein